MLKCCQPSAETIFPEPEAELKDKGAQIALPLETTPPEGTSSETPPSASIPTLSPPTVNTSSRGKLEPITSPLIHHGNIKPIPRAISTDSGLTVGSSTGRIASSRVRRRSKKNPAIIVSTSSLTKVYPETENTLQRRNKVASATRQRNVTAKIQPEDKKTSSAGSLASMKGNQSTASTSSLTPRKGEFHSKSNLDLQSRSRGVSGAISPKPQRAGSPSKARHSSNIPSVKKPPPPPSLNRPGGKVTPDPTSKKSRLGIALEDAVVSSFRSIQNLLGSWSNSTEDLHSHDPHGRRQDGLNRASPRHLRVWVGSWNVAGGLPPSESLDAWIQAATSTLPHVICVGVQELGSLFGSKGNYHHVEWDDMLNGRLNRAGYTVLERVVLGGLHTSIAVQETIVSRIIKKAVNSLATGIGGMGSNKGGTGIAIQLDNISILFINCHLAAHTAGIADRNADYARIETEMGLDAFPGAAERFKGPPKVSDRFDYVFWFGDLNYRVEGKRTMVDALIASNRLEVLLANDQLKRVMMQNAAFQGFHEDRIEFMPTFKFDNSRLDRNSPSSKGGNGNSPVKSTISELPPSSGIEYSSPDSSAYPESAQADLMPTLNSDPLSEGGFVQDSTLTPSLLGTGNVNNSPPPLPLAVLTTEDQKPALNAVFTYDSSPKQRVPSWTDRILFKSSPTMQSHNYLRAAASPSHIITPLNYHSLPLVGSDHQPVMGEFRISHDMLTPGGGTTAGGGWHMGGYLRVPWSRSNSRLFGEVVVDGTDGSKKRSQTAVSTVSAPLSPSNNDGTSGLKDKKGSSWCCCIQ